MLKSIRNSPALRHWIESATGSEEEALRLFQAYVLRVAEFVCVLDVLYPRFVEIDGMVLRLGATNESIKLQAHSLREQGKSEREIEYLINHLHVPDLFVNDPDRDAIDSKVFLLIARMISESWVNCLRRDFPGREFDVEIANDEDPEVSVISLE